VTHPSFDYELVMMDDRATVTSIIAYQERARENLRAVLWSAPRQEWIYAPAIAADIFNDEEDPIPTRSVDRATAERLAEDVLKTRLPSEDALVAISLEGERMGWRFGPPTQ
jgi:hypothetical protein